MPQASRFQAGVYATSSYSQLFLPPGAGGTPLTGKRCVIAIHGRAANAGQPRLFTGWYQHIWALTQAGYVVMSIDAGSKGAGAGTSDATRFANPYGNDVVMTDITAAKNFLLTTLGASGSSKVGFMDYSLGGGQGFNWMSRNSGLCSGAITYAGALDYDFYYNNFANYKAELELSYASAVSTISGFSGTLNQVASTVSGVASTASFPASGTFVLYAIATQAGYLDPVIVTYTGKTTTTFTGCTIASGSRTWGTGTVFSGVATTGGYATNKTTRSPLLIATNVVFDAVPVHCYVAADDATTGRPSTPIKTTSDSKQFTDAVGANATFHSVRGSGYATTHTTITETKTISTSTTLNLADASAWPASGNGVIETATAEPFVFAYTGKTGNQLTGVTAVVPTSQAVVSGQVAYASTLVGHTTLWNNIPASEIVGLVDGFSW